MTYSRDEKLYGLLIHMVDHGERTFDQEAAHFLVQAISTYQLMESSQCPSKGPQGSVLSMNFWSYVLWKNRDEIAAYLAGHTPDMPQVQAWREILQGKDEALVSNAQYDVLFLGLKVGITCNFATMYALYNFSSWFNQKDRTIHDESLAQLNTLAIGAALLEYQKMTPLTMYGADTAMVEFLWARLSQSKEELLKKLGKAKFHEAFCKSPDIQRCLEKLDPSLIKPLLSQGLAHLLTLYTKEKSPWSSKVMNKILSLFSAQEWLEHFPAKDVHLIFNYFYHDKYKYSLKDKVFMSEHVHKDEKRATFIAQLEKFLPVLVQKHLSFKQQCFLCHAFLRTRDTEVMSLFLEYIGLPCPDSTGNDSYRDILKIYHTHEVIHDKKLMPWSDWHKTFMKEQLDKELPTIAVKKPKNKI